ncbi:hypothetical protein [Natrinema salaciae]|uniref:Uncharacterized protein n=1 Tax=Natrinema salaciae TaxID=1186196 RepID=A0A1H9RCQ9_9EURY|nr:hypothetical protein [Natrinema salaciae]SER70502.1 hypothetical protein SAMN04489841_4351 [Natrinema salaciae]
MTWVGTATFGLLSVGAGAFVYVLVANLEPQPEYPALMTDLLRLLGLVIAICGVVVGAAFLAVAAVASLW